MSRFIELFNQYDFNLNENSIKSDIEKILSESFDKNCDNAIYSKILSLIDLTSLNTDDSVDSITEFVDKINKFDDLFEILPHPAAICVYPSFVSTVKDNLQEDLQIASVAGGFPHSQTFIEVKIAEVAMAVMEGATEIDVVLPVGVLLSENYEEVYEQLSEIRSACKGVKLKVILETGLLNTPELIKKASIISMVAGADFIKTSTGKIANGATLEAAYVMCKTIKEFNSKNGSKIGIKISGGVSETTDAVKYYTIVEKLLGEDYLNENTFRIGASKLVNNLLSSISGKDVKYF